MFTRSSARTLLLVASCGAHGAPLAAEGFQIRYNIAGSLGGEMFAPPERTGWAGGAALTQVAVTKISGNDGGVLSTTVPGGTLPLPAPAPAALYPGYDASPARFNASGPMTRWDLGLAYITEEKFNGGRLLFALDLPFARKSQTVSASAATPPLHWHPQVPAALRGAAAGQFDAQYQQALGSQAESYTGDVRGIGDVELMAGWQYVGPQLRVLTGASLILPTGKYDTPATPDIGTGNFITLEPAFQVAYLPTQRIGMVGKMALGLNSRNKDNQLRSGNWVSLELAAGYKTGIGVVGLHAIRAQQYQDDDNNPWGASRFRSTNGGIFFTTIIPGIDAALTVQYMAATSTRNAKHGTASGVRLLKLF